ADRTFRISHGRRHPRRGDDGGPVTARLLRPPPEALRSVSDAARDRHAAPKSVMSRADLLRDQRFVTISAAFALGLFAQVGLFAHLVTRLAPEFGANGA